MMTMVVEHPDTPASALAPTMAVAPTSNPNIVSILLLLRALLDSLQVTMSTHPTAAEVVAQVLLQNLLWKTAMAVGALILVATEVVVLLPAAIQVILQTTVVRSVIITTPARLLNPTNKP